jgi:hypothetical protein
VSVNGAELSPTIASLVAQIKTAEAELREAAQGSTPEIATVVTAALTASQELLAAELLQRINADLREADKKNQVPSDETVSWLGWATRHLVRLGELRQAVSSAPRLAPA